ncbi:MAG: peptide chain release factor N(5)-glutamine methyltransferase [Chloroflexi bacterium]|nr:peptide chain release factor N(5)-glutamine methyltransferase [Chloroflexota bacterium]MCL5076117.1 peptide chain release factor N(5)-glutamine methyltransferase [Chloroflexota bacterium]
MPSTVHNILPEGAQPPPTIGQMVRWAAHLLAGVSSDNYLEAEVLLRHALHLSRTQLYCQPNRLLTPLEQQASVQLIDRRLRHEPIAYITGEKEFYGLTFYVDRSVLIPRPETEHLVEQVLETVAGEEYAHTPLLIADVGTGSGAIAVSLAVRLSSSRIYAIDHSAEAIAVARRNCYQHDVADRVTLLIGDLLAPLPEPVNIIVANLPYIRSDELSNLPTEIRAFEPPTTLNGGPDGLEHYRRLFAVAPLYLKAGGMVFVEIGAGQASATIRLAESHFPKATIAVSKDYSGIERIVSVRT